MDLEVMVLNEISQRKTDTALYHLCVELEENVTHRNSRKVVVRGWR